MTRLSATAKISTGALALLLLLTSAAFARDLEGKYANAPHAEWYRSQHNSSGEWCCNESDAHPYYGDYTPNADGSVTLDGEIIPKEKVLTGPNPTGAAVLWKLGQHIYCFAPGGGV